MKDSTLGLHLTGDLYGCAPVDDLMTEVDALARVCRQATLQQALIVVGERWHRFPDAPDGSAGGVTGVLLLAESHLAVHTWPEHGKVTLDVFVCNHGADNGHRAEALMAAMIDAFRPRQHRLQRLNRGLLEST
ncbi:MAG: adenosylmethionine decarboxylase [Aquabacterium sp.]